MNEQRKKRLKTGPPKDQAKYVLYWMQQSHRVYYNHALNHAIKLANQEGLPLLVYFGLTDQYLGVNLRSMNFALEGLKEVKEELESSGIQFVLKLGKPADRIQELLHDTNYLVMDYGYLKIQKQWRKKVLDEAPFHLTIDLIDTDTIVPVRYASNKEEYGAYTLRPKLKKVFLNFRDYHGLANVVHKGNIAVFSDDDLNDLDVLLNKLQLDRSVPKSNLFKGGYKEAKRLFEMFIENKAKDYPSRNDPSKDYTSYMSMYLHFGQISSLELLDLMFQYLEEKKIFGETFDAYVEQLMVRRELAFNYVTYNRNYDQFEGMTEKWAYHTMKVHELDHREHIYTLEQIEQSKTHDPYFNAAMTEMRVTGFMKGYMRMYWAKKIIEWSPSHKIAYQNTIYLNNKYFIDGRDPNSYASVAWCYGKHDRPWGERPIFGQLRYMNAAGLKRKFDIEAYVKQVNQLSK